MNSWDTGSGQTALAPRLSQATGKLPPYVPLPQWWQEGGTPLAFPGTALVERSMLGGGCMHNCTLSQSSLSSLPLLLGFPGLLPTLPPITRAQALIHCCLWWQKAPPFSFLESLLQLASFAAKCGRGKCAGPFLPLAPHHESD